MQGVIPWLFLAGFVCALFMGLSELADVVRAELRQAFPFERSRWQRGRVTFVRCCPHCLADMPTGERCQSCGKHRAMPPSYYAEWDRRIAAKAEEQPFCYSCGTDYLPGAGFCIGCGKPAPNTGKTRAL